MTKDTRTIEVGDRFEDKDWRNEGRIIEIRTVLSPEPLDHYEAEVEAHPKNPSAVGKWTTLSGATLRSRYRKISR